MTCLAFYTFFLPRVSPNLNRNNLPTPTSRGNYLGLVKSLEKFSRRNPCRAFLALLKNIFPSENAEPHKNDNLLPRNLRRQPQRNVPHCMFSPEKYILIFPERKEQGPKHRKYLQFDLVCAYFSWSSPRASIAERGGMYLLRAILNRMSDPLHEMSVSGYF